MPTTYGGIYYPQGSVRVVYADIVANGDLSPYSYVDLPMPSTRKLEWNQVIIERESYTGEMMYVDKGYKPTLELEFKAPSDTDIGNLIKLCNYKGTVIVFPFFDGTVGSPYNGYGYTLRMKLIESSSIPFGGKNVQVNFKLKFKAVQYYTRMIDPDNLICIIRGAYLSVTSPSGGSPGVVPIRVMPNARRVTVGYFSNKIYCHQGSFN